jgi:hypothetical protein
MTQMPVVPDKIACCMSLVFTGPPGYAIYLYQQEERSRMSERPLGVTILGILWILGGLLMLVGGFVGGAILSVAGLGSIGAAMGVIFFIIGIVDLLLGVGCFLAWSWVWIVGVIFSAISILVGLVSLFTSGLSALLGIVIAAIILWYLFQPQVKAYFGSA